MKIMKNIIYAIVTVAAAFSLYGCVENLQEGFTEEDMRINIGAKVNTSVLVTKSGTNLDYNTDTTVNITLIRWDQNSGGNATYGREELGAVMETFTDAMNWERPISFVTPQFYLNRTDSVGFAGWYPASTDSRWTKENERVVLPANPSEGHDTPYMVYDIDGSTDVMISTFTKGNFASGVPAMQFRHALCMYKFYVYAVDKATSDEWGDLTDMKILNLPDRLFVNLPEQIKDDGSVKFTFSPEDESSEYALHPKGDNTAPISIPYGQPSNAAYIGTVLGGAPAIGALGITARTENYEGGNSVSIARNFTPGYTYNIYIRFSSKGVINAEISVSDWIYDENDYIVDENFNLLSNLSRYGTANSYIVSEPNTTYYFDATVMGTGIATAGLEAPTALDPKDVFVIWETGTEAGNVISSVELTDDGKVVFTTSETVNGNAVIAVTDGVPVIDPYPRDRGTVLWSWHIWATPGVNDVICTNNDGEQFTIMDRNLGDWEQPESSYSTYDGLKYQWGRKDPYVGFNGSGYLLDGSVVFTEPDYEPIVGYATSTESDAATLLEAIQFPEMFFTGTYNNMFDWYGLGAGTDEENLQHRNNYLWGNPDDTAPVKTIYDPCPKGYMVAPAKVFSGFTVDGQNAWIDSSILYEGSFEDGFTFTNASSFFPAAGQLANNSGVLRLVPGPSGREGYYWTSSVGEDGDSRMVDFNKSMLLYNTNKRASGCSVRCVRVL